MNDTADKSLKKLLRWMLACYLTVPVAAWILFEAVLKESSTFWTNAGGWSVTFRHWVLYSFYPSLFLLAAFLLYLSIGGMRHFKFVKAHPIVSLSPLLLAWLVLGATGVVIVTDNMQNIIHGKALHAQ